MRTTSVWGSGVQGLGEFFKAVKNPVNRDPRLMAALGANETVDAEGGFLVPAEFSQLLMEAMENQSNVASICTALPFLTSNRVVLPGVDEISRANGSRWGGIQSAWQPEAATIGTSKGKFESAEIELGKLTAAVFATEELVEDSAVFGTYLERAFGLEGAFRLDEAIILGDGVGKPLGILNAPATVTVPKDSGQAPQTITSSNIQNMFKRMLPQSRARAIWLVSAEAEDALYGLASPSGTPAAALLFASGDAAAPCGRLMSRPIVPCEQCNNIGTLGDIIFADPSYYFVAQRPLSVQQSIHVSYITGEAAFRLTYRVGGQPMLRTPITPYNGGLSKSAFVTLAAR